MSQTIADGLQGIINAKSNIDGAIKAKGGIVTKGLVNTDDDIMTIPSGGGSSGTDVVFYDYDGTIVQSYSAEEFADISSLPENPTHTGLTSQGWNWSLADAKAYVVTNGKLNIGQMYITSDGKTRLYYVIPKDSLTLDLSLNLDEGTELDIDWGDGTEHTTWTSEEGEYSKGHEYSDGGRYVVAITVVSGSFSVILENNYFNIKKVELGNGITSIGDNTFYECRALSSVTIPDGVTSIGTNAFQNCYSLSSITIPDGVTSIGDNTFYECRALSSITIPNSVTSIGSSTFCDCYALSSITIPNSVTSIGEYAFYNCYSLSSITIPGGFTSIGNSAFEGCYSLSSITIPDGVTSIGGYAFADCYALSSITFESSTPPELGGDLSIPTTCCIIKVPQGTLSDYTSASNYPDPSEYIYEEY